MAGAGARGCSGPAAGDGQSGDAGSDLDILPLFERRSALEQATETMAGLYGNEAYARQLELRGPAPGRHARLLGRRQGRGLLASQGVISTAQTQLAELARGGATSICGSSTAAAGRTRAAAGRRTASSSRSRRARSAVASRSPSRARSSPAKFSDPRLADRSLEETVSAVIHATVEPGPEPEQAWLEEMARLAERSRTVYRALVHDDPAFEAVFHECTPIDVIGELNIGSRPASRGGKAVADLRAIPWVFAWMQNRMATPSWYGAGSGLAAGRPRRPARDVGAVAVLPGTDPHARDGADLERPGDRASATSRSPERPDAAATVWNALREEHDAMRRARARDHRARAGSAIRARTRCERHARRQPWLDVLSYMQIDLLRRHRDGDEAARKPLMATVAGIATGLRRTG